MSDRVEEARQLMLEAGEHLAAYRRKVERARRLLHERDADRRAARDAEIAAQVCRCGHRHDQHGLAHSINYTAGFCQQDGCDCRYFLSSV